MLKSFHYFYISIYLLEPFQSGFQAQHSCETALVRVTNDLLLAADSGFISVLLLLDLSEQDGEHL